MPDIIRARVRIFLSIQKPIHTIHANFFLTGLLNVLVYILVNVLVNCAGIKKNGLNENKILTKKGQ